MNKQKGLAPILIVIVVALAVTGYLLYQKQNKPVVPQPVTQSLATPTTSPAASSSAEITNPDSISANWKTYTNNTYKFAFRYPFDWTLKKLDSNCISVTSTSFDALFVCAKNALDATRITRSGVGAGDIIKRGTVQFLDQPVEKNIVFYQEEDKSVLYANAGNIRRGNLVFTISLDHFQPGTGKYQGVAASSEVTSDQILSTFKFTQ